MLKFLLIAILILATGCSVAKSQEQSHHDHEQQQQQHLVSAQPSPLNAHIPPLQQKAINGHHIATEQPPTNAAAQSPIITENLGSVGVPPIISSSKTTIDQPAIQQQQQNPQQLQQPHYDNQAAPTNRPEAVPHPISPVQPYPLPPAPQLLSQPLQPVQQQQQQHQLQNIFNRPVQSDPTLLPPMPVPRESSRHQPQQQQQVQQQQVQQQQVQQQQVQQQQVQQQQQIQQQIQQQQQPQPQPATIMAPQGFHNPTDVFHNHQHSVHPLYLGHNPFIEILRTQSYADDNIVTLNLSHSHIYEIDSDAFVGQRFEHIDLSNNKLGLIHSRSFRIGPDHSRHNPYNPNGNNSKPAAAIYAASRPPPSHPKSVTIDFSNNPAIVALSGAFDHIDVPNVLLNFTNSTVELKFGAFKKYFKDHPGHKIDIESVDCCEQEWLLGYKHNFVLRTYCTHDPNLFLSKVSQQAIIDSCIAYVTSGRRTMTIQGPSVIRQVAAAPKRNANSHAESQFWTYLILGGTAMILSSLSIYIIFYMFSLKAAFVYQLQNKS